MQNLNQAIKKVYNNKELLENYSQNAKLRSQNFSREQYVANFWKYLEKFNKEEGKYINKEIKNTAFCIQTQLITKLIIPYFENNSDGSEIFEKVLKCKNLIKDYFGWLLIDIKAFSEFTETNEYKKLSNMLDKIIIQCIKQNQPNIEKLEKKKIFDFYRILLDKFNEINDSNYRAFVQKIWKRIEKIQLEEDANILEKVKAEIERQDKIDVRLFSKDYKNEYTSVDINKKVSELILRRKLTDVQYRDLQSEIGIYNSCKQVISRKDIKRLKNKDGSTRYYVLINGEEYADPYFKKLKFGDTRDTISVVIEPLTQADIISANPIPIYVTNFISGALCGVVVAAMGLVNNAPGTAAPSAGLPVMFA